MDQLPSHGLTPVMAASGLKPFGTPPTRPDQPQFRERIGQGKRHFQGDEPPEPSVRPEKVQTPFFLVGLVAYRWQPGVGHHRERDMSMPTLPMTYFVFVQAGFAFGFFNALLHCIAQRSDLSHLEQGHIRRRLGKIVSNLFRVVGRTTDNQPGISSRQSVAGAQRAAPLRRDLRRRVCDHTGSRD